jgi:hypothetical protein
MSTSLSKLVADGAGHARLVFGAGGTPVAAEELAATGAGLVQVSEAAPDRAMCRACGMQQPPCLDTRECDIDPAVRGSLEPTRLSSSP